MRITEDQVYHPAVYQWKQEYISGQKVILQAGYNTSAPNEKFQENIADTPILFCQRGVPHSQGEMLYRKQEIIRA